MVEKRKRYMAVRESTSAKRRSASPTRTTETPEVPTRSLTPDVPTTFAKDGPLPVLPKRQSDDLSLKDYKSVAESKVMLESLERSRRKWVDGDIFEKFWTKPLKSRRLDPAELEKNPSKDCMTKLGNATLSCKPHKFEVKLFGVLEPVKAPPAPSQPLQRPPPPVQPQQLPPAAPMVPRPQYTMNTPQQRHLPHSNTGAPLANNSYAQPVQSLPVPAPTPIQTSTTFASQAPAPGPPGNVAASTFHVPAPTPGHPQYSHPQQQHPNPHPQGPQHPQHPQHPHPHPHPHPQQPGNPNMVQPGPHPRPDPVIQSLAVRAASDPDLKALMRIVASGKATTEQLRVFQGHIDALTPASSPPIVPTVGRARPLAPAQGSVGAQVQARPQANQQLHQQHPQNQHQQHQNLQHQQMNHHPQYVQHPQYSQQQSQLHQHRQAQFTQQPAQAPPKPKPFPQPPKQEITSVVFEFTDQFSQGDRFIFPKYTILEYAKNGTMVTASFIVTRKPIDDLDEYYQPVTIILESSSPRTLEILQKVVADQETTCNHMKRLMSTLKRADDSFLVFRLRRDPNEVVPDKPEVIEAPPPRAARESRVRRDTSTPVRDLKGTTGDMAQPPPSRPRVKTVKKALPKEPPHAAITTSANTNHSYLSSSATASALSPTTPRTPHPKPPKPPKPPRSRKGRIADPTKSCSICKTSKTSLWRKADIEGENVTVCNACGIKWKTNAQRAAQVAAAAATGQPLPPSRENSISGGQRPTLQQLTSGGPAMQFHPFPQGAPSALYPSGSFPQQQQFNGFQAGSSAPPSTQEVGFQDEPIVVASVIEVVEKSPVVVDNATSSIVASHVAAHSAQPQQQPQVQAATAPVVGNLTDGTAPV